MKPFRSAGDAIKWAVAEYESWMFGKAQPVGPRVSASTDGHQAHVSAISILEIAKKHDVTDREGDSWIYCWYVAELPEWSWRDIELEKLRGMRSDFEQALRDEGIIFS